MLGWWVAREAAGASLADYLQRHPGLAAEAKLEVSDLAARYSSRNPLLHWVRGGVYYSAAIEDSDQAQGLLEVVLEEWRQATQEGPEDYRFWISLGKVLDRTGANLEAGVALGRALRLAPNHFEPHWVMGNHLLRDGQREAAFAQMRQALAARPSALPLVFDYAWLIFNGNGKAIAAALEAAPEMKAQIASLLVLRGKVDEGLSIWRDVTAPGLGDTQRFVESLTQAGKFASAYEIWKSASLRHGGAEATALDWPEPDANSMMAEGDFEDNFRLNSNVAFFAWHIAPSQSMRAYLERKDPYEGKQCLRFSFNMDGNTPITLGTQTVPVKPGRRYCLSFYVKTDGLESLSTPYVEIFDSADPKRAHVETRHFPTRSNRWAKYGITIAATELTEALTIRLQRQPCTTPPCPIEGRIWFDHFRLVECADVKKIEPPIQTVMETGEEIEVINEN